MRKARYDMRQVICPNATTLGHCTVIAKPGRWIAWDDGAQRIGRVLGRIAETDYRDGTTCAGWLAVIGLFCEATAAGIRWVNPAHVQAIYKEPPAQLLAWLTGAEWVKNKNDIARIIAMSQHGTLSESYIANRDNPEQAYNARPEYVAQFILN